MATRIIGMDPGVTGAMALLSPAGELLQVVDMPIFDIKGKSSLDVHQLGQILRGWSDDARVIIEHVGAMPGQGVTSMFTFGFGAGALHGAVGALGLPLETVRPQVWKKHFKLGADKAEARRAATRLWPQGPFGRVKDAGRAEAALIALYSIQTRRS